MSVCPKTAILLLFALVPSGFSIGPIQTQEPRATLDQAGTFLSSRIPIMDLVTVGLNSLMQAPILASKVAVLGTISLASTILNVLVSTFSRIRRRVAEIAGPSVEARFCGIDCD